MEKVGTILGALGALLLITVLFAWPNMWLWNNALVGAVDGINPIGFWQSLGITFLFSSLFKSNSSK
jgi:hypothetical protein